MSDFKDMLREASTIMENHDLDVTEHDDGSYSLLDKNGEEILINIQDFDELHAVLMGFEHGYQAAVKFYKVVKY